MIQLRINTYDDKDLLVLSHTLNKALYDLQLDNCDYDCANCKAKKVCRDLRDCTAYLFEKINKTTDTPIVKRALTKEEIEYINSDDGASLLHTVKPDSVD